MQDPLKKHIDRHRPDFEPYQADFGALWDRVEARLDAQPPKRRPLWPKALRIAAALALAAGLAWLSWPRPQPLAQAPSEWQEAQQFYAEAIQANMQALKARKADVAPEIFADLNALDQAMKELQADLRDQADNEEVIEAMIRNYQLKLKILEEILEQLQQYEEDQPASPGSHPAA
jgi:hypothetical protein